MCDNTDDKRLFINSEWVDEVIDEFSERLEIAVKLNSVIDQLPVKDQDFASSMLNQLYDNHSLSPKQWKWVKSLYSRVAGCTPIYGSFDAILVMFRLASEHIKKPKIRLLSDEGVFVQLTFFPERAQQDGMGEKTIEIHTGGWAGHGRRLFAGWIHGDKIIPYKEDTITDDIKYVIQELSLDPMGCAKAMAKKLSACMYCGKRLAEQESKDRGYGPICADHYQLPWGNNIWFMVEEYKREHGSDNSGSAFQKIN